MKQTRSERRLLSAIALLAGLGATLLALAPAADLPPVSEEGHRPLRENPAGPEPDPTPPAGFTGYPDAPDFDLVSRREALSHYPCAECHAHMPANPERRKLFSPHPGVLDHGDGRFWCLDCHDAENRNELTTLAGGAVDFDRADQVCSQCHAGVHRDWTFGAHGKRVARWQGERSAYSCAHCHNPHDPRVRPRAPEGPPGVRAGLEPMPDKGRKHPRVYPWQPVDEESEHD
ncbi:MAG: hypothetical protein ABR612_06545 [Chromatocurvus sp.]